MLGRHLIVSEFAPFPEQICEFQPLESSEGQKPLRTLLREQRHPVCSDHALRREPRSSHPKFSESALRKNDHARHCATNTNSQEGECRIVVGRLRLLPPWSQNIAEEAGDDRLRYGTRPPDCSCS